MGILRTKRDNNKFKEARKWLDKHPEEAAKMDICMTEEELIEELKKESASVDIRDGIDGFIKIMERNDEYDKSNVKNDEYRKE